MIFTIIHPKGNVESCTITIISPQEEFLQASDLAGAILDHREKEGNLVFFQQVLSFASNEHKKALGQAKVLLTPRVKTLLALVAAAKYQCKHAARMLVKQKTKIYKSETRRVENARLRQEALEAENARLEAIEEREHRIACHRMVADIEALLDHRIHCCICFMTSAV